MLRACVGFVLVMGAQSISIKQGVLVPTDMNPLDLNPDNIAPGEPDYTYGTNQPTFTNDGNEHVMKSLQGCQHCDDQSGREFPSEDKPYVEDHGHDPYGNQMRLKQDPGSQQQQQEGPNGYGDRTFENQGDSKQEHTVQEDEPNECNHCAKENAAVKAAQAAQGGFVQNSASTKQDPQQQQQQEGPNGYGDRTFENQGDSKQEHTVQEDEPNECNHCAKENAAVKAAQAAEAGLVQKSTSKKQDPQPYGDLTFVDPAPSGPIVYTERDPGPPKPNEYTLSESEPNECVHCAKENAAVKAADTGFVQLRQDPQQQQQQEGPNGYGDRTFENQGDSKQEHTVQEDEPNECNHCAKENAAVKAAQAAQGGFVQKVALKRDDPLPYGDRSFVTGSKAWGYDDQPRDAVESEPNECSYNNCAKGKGEEAAPSSD